MAKILYGVCGEGSGHSSRARLIAGYLQAQGHQVKLVSYDRGYRNLKDDFDVLPIIGLSIVSEDNEVSKLRTISENLSKLPDGARALKTLRATFKSFEPDCVLCDFEPCTAYRADHYDLPLVSIDNQHRMRYMAYKYPDSLKKDALVTETVIRAMVPKPWVSLITTFHQGPLKNNRSFLFPPILREEIFQLEAKTKDHILVYVTSGFDSLINMLPHFIREEFIVYGGGDGVIQKEGTQGNVTFKGFSPTGFADDLANAKAVIATAGFTLISEALYLGKPYLAFPMQGQFEQCLNALMLAQQGYGAECDSPDQTAIAAFLYHLPEYVRKLQQYPRQGNTQIQEKLDELLADDLALLRTFGR